MKLSKCQLKPDKRKKIPEKLKGRNTRSMTEEQVEEV